LIETTRSNIIIIIKRIQKIPKILYNLNYLITFLRFWDKDLSLAIKIGTGGVAQGRSPALQVQSPEFKPQSHQKKKKSYSN
jgi:hypothetical protein